MNLVKDLDQAKRVLKRCEGNLEYLKAKMNFIVNLVTILEVFSRNKLQNSFDDQLLDGSFALNMILHVVGKECDRRAILKMIELRNAMVHEGKTENLTDEEVHVFYTTVKSIITKSNGKEHRRAT